MTIKSFDEMYAQQGERLAEDFGKDKTEAILHDARKIYETLKTPEAIDEFAKSGYEKRQEMVKGLSGKHFVGMGLAHKLARDYAEYVQKEQPQPVLQKPQASVYADKVRSKIERNKKHMQKAPSLKGKSGAVVADEIAKRLISGEENRVITPEVGKELSDSIKKSWAQNKQNV